MLTKKVFVKTPLVAKLFYPSLTWKYSRTQKKIYLTFDDGPTPNVTEKVLQLLADYNAKATFFCVGQQAEKHTGLLQQICDAQHSIGNHTYSHKKGWKTKTDDYLADVEAAKKIVASKLFRPPYGKVSRLQLAELKHNYKIVMWDVLSYDFDKKTLPQQCATNVIKNARNGSIVVFHDSAKAQENMLFALPLVLQHFKSLGYEFCAIK
jgi:peptidoglycan-N-acetylglucosamine deacetylase